MVRSLLWPIHIVFSLEFSVAFQVRQTSIKTGTKTINIPWLNTTVVYSLIGVDLWCECLTPRYQFLTTIEILWHGIMMLMVCQNFRVKPLK